VNRQYEICYSQRIALTEELIYIQVLLRMTCSAVAKITLQCSTVIFTSLLQHLIQYKTGRYKLSTCLPREWFIYVPFTVICIVLFTISEVNLLLFTFLNMKAKKLILKTDAVAAWIFSTQNWANYARMDLFRQPKGLFRWGISPFQGLPLLDCTEKYW
jgi:hypothetical protein